ncbi:MAG: MoaD/ThiS family protein [Methanosarcinales archaeon]|nr:MoaD/ThiS family protein [Methanosarcinales archaeon]MCD4841218.1 MoaD/ThiS family protein [Methanosarcinales archaeon]
MLQVRIKILAGGVLEKTIEVEEGSTYSDILAELGINPETVVVMVDGRPVPIDDIVDSSRIDILRIVSGG